MTLQDQLTEDMRQAMRSGDTVRRDVVRLARNAISYAEKAKGGPLDAAEAITALQQQARQRRDSIEAFRAVGRNDREAQESAELAILEEYLPQLMGRDEVEAVRPRDHRRVGRVRPRRQGQGHGPA